MVKLLQLAWLWRRIYHNVWAGSQMKMWHVQKIIQRANLPISCPQIPLDDFLGYMAHDKKFLMDNYVWCC